MRILVRTAFCVLLTLLVSARQDCLADKFKVLRNISYRPSALSEYEKERCRLDLYLPEDSQHFATLIWIHGGALRGGHKADDIAASTAERFASDGVAVASINYRLSPKVNFPAYIEDTAAAVAFVRMNISEHGGSPDRVFVSGHSAGGYLTLMVGLDPQYLGRHDLSPQQLAGFIPVAGQTVTHSTVREERGIPKTRPIIDDAAPCYHVSKQAPPFLCIAGDNDLPARAAENIYFVAAMKAAGHQDVHYMEFDNRNHGTIASKLSDPDDSVAAAIHKFINEH